MYMFGIEFSSFAISGRLDTAFALLVCSDIGLTHDLTRSEFHMFCPSGENTAVYAPSSLHRVCFADFNGLKMSQKLIVVLLYLRYLV